MAIYALIDCNAFYCSCERICQPELKRVPVAVLSNNDGCVIARTAEVKALGVPMGAPYFKYREQLRLGGVAVRSSNYTLYADISNRVMSIIRDMVPAIEVYSIDECWADLTGVEDPERVGRAVRNRLLTWVGMPTGVGISTTKTLAKLANWAAKSWKGTGAVVDLTDPSRQARLLKLAPVSEVWGVGRRLSGKLAALGIETAHDLAYYDVASLRKRFGVTLERTARELRGIDCIGLNEGPPPKQAICSSKMFGSRLHALPPIREAMASYVSRAAEKLRLQHSLCGALQVSLQTQLHDPFEPRYANALIIPLQSPSDDTRILVALALKALDELFVPGYAYSKCSVVLLDLCQRRGSTEDLFASAPRRNSGRLMATIDDINRQVGRGAVRLGRVPASPEWGMRREMVSRSFTTDWNELITLRG
ncbi:Y-family DNA polymerase [Pseudomonas sp. Marseille-QA0892]